MATFHPKVSAGMFAGFVTTVVITELNRRGITVDGNEAAAITGLLTIAAGYFMPSGDADTPPPAQTPTSVVIQPGQPTP